MDVYEAIHRRRDVRREFTGAALADGALMRVLAAAHAAPSVGLSQPWDFVIVDDGSLKHAFRDHVERQRQAFASELEADRAGLFGRIKIEGISESSLSIVVTYDPDRGAPAVLGRRTIADTGLFSTCLAIQNLWLAATAEGLGVGWVSFYEESFLSGLLGIPSPIRPIAWLCIGPTTQLGTVPDLERDGWQARRPLAGALHYNGWRAGGAVK